MKTTMKSILLTTAALALSGCTATVFRGTTQSISINSDPVGALVTMSNEQTCTTPCDVEVDRKHTIQLTFEKEGCRKHTRAMVPTLGAGVLFGGIIDYGTGAVYDLQPNPMFVNLTCEDWVE